MNGPMNDAHVTDEFERIVRANQYMVLATSDDAGVPWASPVWFATDDARTFYWISSPEARHSRNLATRPQIAIAIFDSTQPAGTGSGVYLAATAAQLAPEELASGVAVYSAVELAADLSPLSVDDVQPPAKHRLYRATAIERFILDDHDERVAVP
jgi:uncharacterized protein YhbP (UPF0306 family)